MRYIIIGGTGFIGKHLANKLLSLGEKVIAIGRREQAIDINNENYSYIQGDCNNTSLLESVVNDNDVVFYLAYNSIPKTSFENPIKDIQENLPLAISIFSALSKKKIRSLIYVSSGGTIYGKVKENIPITENEETHPISPYGITKLAIEKYANFYAEMYDLPVSIVRPANPYGALQQPFKGQGFIATAIGAIMSHLPLDVYGMNGTIRDYIHIDDLISGLIAVLSTNATGYEIYNIGSELGKSNFDVLNVLKKIAGKEALSESDLKINIKPARSFDVPYNVLDSSKLKKLGWKPAVQFEEGLQRTWEWHKDHNKI